MEWVTLYSVDRLQTTRVSMKRLNVFFMYDSIAYEPRPRGRLASLSNSFAGFSTSFTLAIIEDGRSISIDSISGCF